MTTAAWRLLKISAVALLLLGAVALPGTAQAYRVFVGVGLPFIGFPGYYAPYYAPYYPPPVYYAPPPVYYAPPPPAYVLPPAYVAPGARVGTRCNAGAYVCPVPSAVVGGACTCPTGSGVVNGRVG